jgi:hypothetical protein
MPKHTRTGANAPKSTAGRSPKPTTANDVAAAREQAAVALATSAAEYDARLKRFLDELGSLSEDQWVLVAERFLAQKRTLAQARKRVDDIMADLSNGKMKPFGRTPAKWRVAVKQANSGMHSVTTGLPKAKTMNGKTLPLQETAYLAVYHALNALKVFAELDHTPGGRERLLTLLSPFQGITTDVFA